MKPLNPAFFRSTLSCRILWLKLKGELKDKPLDKYKKLFKHTIRELLLIFNSWMKITEHSMLQKEGLAYYQGILPAWRLSYHALACLGWRLLLPNEDKRKLA